MTSRISTIHAPSKMTQLPGAWLRLNDDYDPELAEYEANVYRDADGSFWAGWYHQDVGLVTFHGPFAEQSGAEEYLEDDSFDYYGS